MTTLQEKIDPFINSVNKSLNNRNYYAALTVCMTLPDICSKMEYPKEKNTGKRYSRWFDEYLSYKYKIYIGIDREEYVFLSGKDFYALRCSFLHHGETDIITQKAREVLEDFVFIEPPKWGYVHNNKLDNKLQLQIDVFCNDILDGVNEWMLRKENDDNIIQRSKKLMSIQKDVVF